MLDEVHVDWISKMLLEGYEHQIVGCDFMASNWASQLDVLLHDYTSIFSMHCMCNFTLESINIGFHMVAWLQHLGQFCDSILVAKELKVGMEAKKWKKAN